MELQDVRRDLIEEQDALDAVLSQLTPEEWSLPTSSPGWTVADQVAHLAHFDDVAATAIKHPDEMPGVVERFLSVLGDGPTALDDMLLAPYREMSPEELHRSWRAHRDELRAASTKLDETSRVEWFGPSMGAKSFLTARMMEDWAHGQDIIDAVNLRRSADGSNRGQIQRPASDRLSHIARLGFITRQWSYVNRGAEMPDTLVKVSLVGPTGDRWDFGPADAPDSVQGAAEDFCLVVTQRRHPDDTDLVISGPSASEWMLQAQVFAGGPTDGPPPRQS